MKYLLHALLVSTYFLGFDLIANEGAGTLQLLRDIGVHAMWADAKLQYYHLAGSVGQEVDYYRPELAVMVER